MASVAKWLSVCLWTKWLLVQIPLQSLKTSDNAPISSKEFLDIQMCTWHNETQWDSGHLPILSPNIVHKNASKRLVLCEDD